MRALLVASLLVFGVSAFAEDQHGHAHDAAAKGTEGTADTASADTKGEMKKMMSNKEASAACKKDGKKGKELKSCIDKMTKG